MRGSAAMNWMCYMEVNIMAVRAEINYSRSGPLLNVFRLLHWKLMLPARQFEFAHLRANERSQTLKQTFGCFSFFGCCEVFCFSLYSPCAAAAKKPKTGFSTKTSIFLPQFGCVLGGFAFDIQFAIIYDAHNVRLEHNNVMVWNWRKFPTRFTWS